MLLGDEPSTEDEFGPHRRVGKAIAMLVTSEPGGRTIGLEGSWGSGKSTVVNLLQEELTESANTKVIVFDAWAHQGDPLRRTVLETLIDGVATGPNPFVDAAAWDLRREELARRRRVATERKVPSFGTAAQILAFLMLLAPIGLVLLSVGSAMWNNLDSNNYRPTAMMVLGGILVVLPVIWLAVVIAKSRGKDGNKSDASGTWALVTQNAVTETQSETTETPDPTSVEFESTFCDLMEEALADPQRRLVVILDNLDRVASSDALTVWSALQVFKPSPRRNTPWTSRLWTIVPYDREGISDLWESERTDAETPLANAFLDKSFQVTFEVPPPVLSDWQRFLKGNLQQAFSTHTDQDFHAVYRVFLEQAGANQTPTPRAIKVLINEMGALHRQWADQFSLAAYAYYVQERRRAHGRFLNRLRDGKLTASPELASIDSTWQNQIAAIHLNLPIEHAIQVVLRGPIEQALADGSGALLQELNGRHGSGFWAVFEEAVAGGAPDWQAVPVSEFILAGSAVGALKPAADPERIVLERIKVKMRDVAQHATSWDTDALDTRVAKLVPALCAAIEAPAPLTDALVEQCFGYRTGESSSPTMTPDEWAEACVGCLAELAAAGNETAFGGSIAVGATAEAYLEISRALAGQDPDGQWWPTFRPVVAADALENHLAERVAAGEASAIDLPTVVRVTRLGAGKPRTKGLIAAAVSRLDAGHALSTEEVAALLGGAWELMPADEASAALQQAATTGHLLHHLATAQGDWTLDAHALVLLTLLNSNPALADPSPVGNSQQGVAQVQELMTRPAELDDLAPVVLEFALHYGYAEPLSDPQLYATALKPLMLAVLRAIVRGPEPLKILGANFALSSTALVAEALSLNENDDRAALEAFGPELCAAVCAEPFSGSVLPQYHILLELFAADLSLEQYIFSGVDNLPVETWVPQLRGKEPPHAITVLAALHSGPKQRTAGINFKDALASVIGLIGEGSLKQAALPSAWSDAFAMLHVELRDALILDVRDVALNHAITLSDSFFDIVEVIPTLAKLTLEEEGLRKLWGPLVESGNSAGLKWMASILEADPQILESASDAEIPEFRARVQAALPVAEELYRADLERIATSLGIEVEAIGGEELSTDGRSE